MIKNQNTTECFDYSSVIQGVRYIYLAGLTKTPQKICYTPIKIWKKYSILATSSVRVSAKRVLKYFECLIRYPPN